MDKTGANAFIFAKASGNLSKSFIGSRAHLLFEQKSLGELWKLIFNTQAPMVPEVMLAQKIEEEAFSNFISEYIKLVKYYDKPEKLLISNLYIYEVENLKEISAALLNKEEKLPAMVELKDYSRLNYDAWPNILNITKKTPYAWMNSIPEIHQQQNNDHKLDIQIIHEIWKNVQSLSGEDGKALKQFYTEELILKNIIWALRLKIFYKMPDEKIYEKLIYVNDSPSKTDLVIAPAMKALALPIDEHSAWEKWKYYKLVNPYYPGEVWEVRPEWIEKMGNAYINKRALNLYHQFPMSVTSLIYWYKIKDFELSCIRTAVESLRLNITADEAMNAVGIIMQGEKNG